MRRHPATPAAKRSQDARQRLHDAQHLALRHRLSPAAKEALYGRATPEPLPRGLPEASPAARKRLLALQLRMLQAEYDAL